MSNNARKIVNIVAIMLFLLSMIMPAFENRFQSIPVLVFALSGNWLYFTIAIFIFGVLGLKYRDANFFAGGLLIFFILSLSTSYYSSSVYITAFGVFRVSQLVRYGAGFYVLVICAILFVVSGLIKGTRGILEDR